RTGCVAVNIPDYGVLFIGGFGRNRSPLRSTELLTRRSGEVGGGGDENWEWLPYTPMNEEHNGEHFAAYFQGRVYVVSREERGHKMEMLDVTAGGQWTSLTSFGLSRRLYSMAIFGNELFVLGQGNVYSVELDGDAKRRFGRWKKGKSVPYGPLMTVHLK
ncbi:unnamed protein product, partial [Hymenolepis diminuta]